MGTRVEYSDLFGDDTETGVAERGSDASGSERRNDAECTEVEEEENTSNDDTTEAEENAGSMDGEDAEENTEPADGADAKEEDKDKSLPHTFELGRTSISAADIEAFEANGYFPEGYGRVDEETVPKTRPDEVVVFAEYFEVGLRFPCH